MSLSGVFFSHAVCKTFCRDDELYMLKSKYNFSSMREKKNQKKKLMFQVNNNFFLLSFNHIACFIIRHMVVSLKSLKAVYCSELIEAGCVCMQVCVCFFLFFSDQIYLRIYLFSIMK